MKTRGRGSAAISNGLAESGSNEPPLVSVVIATRNADRTLEACLSSIFGQSLASWEVLVVDGASSDDTVAILERHSARIARWISEPDTGIYAAWNKALPFIRGEWVLFLGADDRLASPEVFETAAPHLRAAEAECRVVYGSVDLVDGEGKVVATLGWPWLQIRDAFSLGMFVPHCGAFHHRTLFAVHGGFDTSYRIAGDYEFLLRELPAADARFMDDVTVTTMGTAGVSNQEKQQVRSMTEAHRARREHGLTRTPEWAAPGLLRLRMRRVLVRTIGPDATRLVAQAYRVARGRPRHPGPVTPTEHVMSQAEEARRQRTARTRDSTPR